MKNIPGSTRAHYLARVCVLLITAALIAGMAGCTYNPPPYQDLEIRTWYDLDNVRNNLAGHHTLMNNLNSTTPGYEELASPTANNGTGWQPIGSWGTEAFNGTFDGRGYEIQDVFINRPDEDYVGLFGVVGQYGIIKDIGVMNATVTGRTGVGGLVGSNGIVGSSHYATVTNAYSSGGVTGEGFVGGLVGGNVYGSIVSNSHSSSNVTANSLIVGGLVGVNVGTVS